jgi:hypothetical protein
MGAPDVGGPGAAAPDVGGPGEAAPAAGEPGSAVPVAIAGHVRLLRKLAGLY